MTDRNGNIYTIIYAMVLAAIVAGVLALVSVALAPRQAANAEAEALASIKAAARLSDASVDSLTVGNLTVYECISGFDTVTVIPCHGKGLWGPIWGYVALEKDLTSVRGVSFDHKSETPGLGAQIAESRYHRRFIGRPLKAGSIYHLDIDGISGATRTSRSLEVMLDECMNTYASFMDSLRAAREPASLDTKEDIKNVK